MRTRENDSDRNPRKLQRYLWITTLSHSIYYHFLFLVESDKISESEVFAKMPMSEIHLYTDGGSRGNPGPGAIGIVIVDTAGNELQTHAEVIGNCTNNQAEYKALIKGLEIAAGHTRTKVSCFMDSEVVAYQMNGVYRLKNPYLRDLFQLAMDAKRAFREVIFQHVPRTNKFIQRADAILNQALDGKYQVQPMAQ